MKDPQYPLRMGNVATITLQGTMGLATEPVYLASTHNLSKCQIECTNNELEIKTQFIKEHIDGRQNSAIS